MENISKEYIKVRRDSDIYTDTSQDYSLPDYNGDIKKVLYTAAAVSPASKFNDGDSISASGIVTYDVIYINSENEIDHITFTSDYDISAKLRCENLVGSDMETHVSGFSHRLLGPRRINMKASLVSEIRTSESLPIETLGNVEGNSDIESVVNKLDVAYAAFAHSTEREYADLVAKIDGVMADEVEVIYSQAIPAFDEVCAEDGGVGIKGSFNVLNLVKCGRGAPILYKKKLPFDEFVECDDVSRGMSVTAYANINSLRCDVTAEENGASLSASLISEYGVRAYGNKEITVVKDAYLKNAACDNEYENFVYSSHVASEGRLHTASHSIPLSEICDGGVRNVIYMSGSSKVNDIIVEDGGAAVSAEMKMQGVCADVNDDGEETYHSVKFSFQTTQKVNFNCQIPQNSLVECKIRVVDVVATLDEENLYVDVSYMLDGLVEASMKAVRMTSCLAREGGEFPKRESEIVVYYPEGDDTLFSVAKKYHTSARTIAADNMLSQSVMNSFAEPGSLSGIKKLIIK